MDIKGRTQEFEGRTVEEAISKAVASTGVSKDRMDIKIVCEEEKGLFGMQGARPAKIKITVKT